MKQRILTNGSFAFSDNNHDNDNDQNNWRKMEARSWHFGQNLPVHTKHIPRLLINQGFSNKH